MHNALFPMHSHAFPSISQVSASEMTNLKPAVLRLRGGADEESEEGVEEEDSEDETDFGDVGTC